MPLGTAVRESSHALLGLSIACLEWGSRGELPVLALHGWLDNAASFDRLAPALAGMHVVAPDLAGHGLSDHKPASGSYNLWDDLSYLVALVDALGWERFAILGHSRGAMVGLLLASALPERVSALACIDGLWPEPLPACDAPAQLGRHLHDMHKPRADVRAMGSAEDALQQRARASACRTELLRNIVERNLRQDADGWRWRWDRRLLASSAFKLDASHCEAFARAVQAPMLLALASRGLGADPALRAQLQSFAHIQLLDVDGSHHLHLEDTGRDVLAPAVQALFSRFSPLHHGSSGRA